MGYETNDKERTMTFTAKHLAVIHYLEARGGRALTDDHHFDASLLNTLYDSGLVRFVGMGDEGGRSEPDGPPDVVVLRYAYRATLRELLANQRREDDREGK